MNRTYKALAVFATLGLLLLTGCAGTESSRSTGTYIDDKAISTKVKTQLAQDSITQAINVEVETYSGVVQLSGFVDSPEKIERAEEIARSVSGVRDVENDMKLR